MRIVEKLLYGICGILGLMLLFLLICHLNPTLAKGFASNVEAKAVENNVPSSEVKLPITTEKESPIKNIEIENVVLGTSEYEVPDISALEISNAVLGLMGMEFPKGNRTDVSAKRAEELKQDLTQGDLGEDLSYDQKFYPYYYMLNEDEQKLYKQIHANANNTLVRFAPVQDNYSTDNLKRAFTAVVNDHPELFWVNTEYGFYVDPSKKIIEIDLNYNFTAKDLESSKNKFNEAAQEIIYGSRGAIGDYEKEVYVHDALAKNTVYDLNAPANQSAYSALVTDRTVCAGYARAFQYIMQELGVPTYYCTGYSGENHAWDIIKLDNEYYDVDVTWDDQSPLIYDYFNKSDKDYKKDHIRKDMAVNLPPCLGDKYSNLEKNKTVEEPKKEEAPKNDKVEEAQIVATESAKDIETQVVKTEEVSTYVYPPKVLDYHIFDDADEYYLECAHRMMEDKDRNISFNIYLEDEEMWNEIKQDYIEGVFESAYLNRVLAERHAKGAAVSVTGQVMPDKTVKVRHNYTIY